ncbi:hypothetical protein BPOR_0031g00120 [Botrytis porri]|uniref:Uncharacterized protein n=1 Tax=Botrytis porri TaxID=87229 RepID=A0A4Z1L428_9HELO|nr:hypothetical protein BPOR_0031g00120 [Botrytis porri]
MAKPYNVNRILTANYGFIEGLYRKYSPVFLSTGVCVELRCEGKTISRQWKLARDQDDDIHMKLTKKWYITLGVIILALPFVVIFVWDTHFPWWAFIVCVAIPVIWTLPIGIIFATINIQIGLNVFTEFVIGYMLPGRPFLSPFGELYDVRIIFGIPLKLIVNKYYRLHNNDPSLVLSTRFKLGHYFKVTPRTMFFAECVAAFWSSIVQIAVMNWVISHILEICTRTQNDFYTCPGPSIYFTTSIIWGVIGPSRIFSSPEPLYQPSLCYFLIGALLPILTYFVRRANPRSLFKYLIVPVMFGGLQLIPPATGYKYLCWGLVGFVFQYWIRRRWRGWWRGWWEGYVCLLSAISGGLRSCDMNQGFLS